MGTNVLFVPVTTTTIDVCRKYDRIRVEEYLGTGY